MPSSTQLRAVVFLLALGVQVPAALAQTRDATPGGGSLFGGTDARSAARRQFVDLTVSASAVRDDDLGAEQGVIATSLDQRTSGQYSDLDMFLSLAQTQPRFSITARAAGSLRRYPDLNSFIGSNQSAGTALTIALTRKTTFRADLDGNYVSDFAFDTYARRAGMDQSSPSSLGLAGGAAAEDASFDSRRTSYGGTGELTRALGRTSAFTLIGGARHSERSTIGERIDERTLATQFRHNVGRDTLVQLAYTVRQGAQRLGVEEAPFWSQDAQFGVERQWRRSGSRRTMISLSGGPSVLQGRVVEFVTVESPDEPDASPPIVEMAQVDRRVLNFVGTLALTHEMGRTWSARASYRRGGGFRNAVPFANTAAFDVRGTIGRRVGLGLSAGYTDGDVGLSALQSRDSTSFGSARLNVALARSVALYGQYFLYQYEFPAGMTQLEAYPRQMDRRGLRFGVTVWMPLQRG